jgi:hypothetical protein
MTYFRFELQMLPSSKFLLVMNRWRKKQGEGEWVLKSGDAGMRFWHGG